MQVSGIERRGMRRGSWQKGCLITLAVVMALLLALGVTGWVMRKRLMAMTMNTTAAAMVDNSTLSSDQKVRIKRKVSLLMAEYENGKLTIEQLAEATRSVAQSPFFPLALIRAAETMYVGKSGLTKEEKGQAKIEIARFSRGVADDKLVVEDVRSVMAYISTPHGPNAYELKQTVTDVELRKFIEELKTKADKAAVAQDVTEFDLATEFEKAIDRGLTSQGATPVTPPAAPEKAPAAPGPESPEKKGS